MATRLLLIDDDTRLAAMVADYLRGHGYEVDTRGDLAAGRTYLTAHPCDALVLDRMLPDGDGLDLARELRADDRWRALPLLMLTARGDADERVQGLEGGADDYLPKPFELRELLARLRALLRRAALPGAAEVADEGVLRFGRLEIDMGTHQARLDGLRCDLTGRQFDMLALLARHAGRTLTRDEIMDALQGHPLEAFDRSIDVHISRIRNAIEDDAKHPVRLLTVRGSGYLFTRKQDAD